MDFSALSSDILRGYIDLMILRALLDGDSYGYEISKKITEISINTYTMKETTLYSAFSRLEKQGYLSPYPGTYTGGRKRTYYKLTTAGQVYYKNKCVEWKMTKNLINNFIKEAEHGGN